MAEGMSGTTGQLGTMSRHVPGGERDGQGHPPKGCPMSRLSRPAQVKKLLDDGDVEPGVGVGVRRRAADGCVAEPADPPRPYRVAEWRKLPAVAIHRP